MNKYKNKPITINGIWFQSTKEGNRYAELKLLEKAGQISNLLRQVKYDLIPKQGKERTTCYKADFVYTENGKEIVEDVKSEITRKKPDYIIKRKLMKWIHGIEVREV